MGKKFGEDNKDIQFHKFEKLLNKNKNKVDFSNMSPYEIINHLRDEDVRKNYKVLPSNRFVKKMFLTSFVAICLIVVYTVTGSGAKIQKNINIFVNKIDDKRESEKIIKNSLDYIIQGNFETLINVYRDRANDSYDNHFELVTMLNSISNVKEAKDELLKLKSKIEQSSLIKNPKDMRQNIYKLIDGFLLTNSLDEVKNILDRYRQALGNEVLFKEKEILYNLVLGNEQEAINIYSSIDLNTLNDEESILIYGKLSVIFDKIDKSIEALDKLLSLNINNMEVLPLIENIIAYNNSEFNQILNSYIEQNPENERLKLIRAIGNSSDLSKTQNNIEDIDSVIKVHLNDHLPKIVKLDILTKASRNNEALVIVNEFKGIENKTYDIYYALAKYSLNTNSFNDALNYVKESISLNPNFSENYDILLRGLINENKSININYFYLKMKSLDLLNTNIDKNFVDIYINNLNDINNALEILNFSNRISSFEANLKYKMAEIYIDQKRYEEAKQKLYETIALEEKSIYYRTLGVLLVQIGEVEDGINNIRKAYALDPSDILNLNNAGAYYANIEKDIQKAFSNIKAAYEGLNETYNQYEAFIIRENYFKLESIYNHETGESTTDEIPQIDYLY